MNIFFIVKMILLMLLVCACTIGMVSIANPIGVLVCVLIWLAGIVGIIISAISVSKKTN